MAAVIVTSAPNADPENTTTASTTPSFSYLLNVKTVVSAAGGGSRVFYLDRGEWYGFSVGLKNTAEAVPKKLSFQVQLDFVSEDARRNRDALLALWSSRHPDERILELASTADDNDAGRVHYDGQTARYITEIGPEAANGESQITFRLCVNALESQFWREQGGDDGEDIKPPILNIGEGFYLMVSTYDDTSGVLLDTTLCRVRTFWKGRSAINADTDRYRLLEANVKVACPEKYALIQTILNPTSPSELKIEETGSAMSIVENSSPAKAQLSADHRLFICLLKAPVSSAQTKPTTYLDKDTPYSLVVKSISYTFPGAVVTTVISVDFGTNDAPVAEGLTNWSILSGHKNVFSVDYGGSELDEAVLDLFQVEKHQVVIRWVPLAVRGEEEMKVALCFHGETSKLARFLGVQDLTMRLIVETTEEGSEEVLERSDCQIRIFPPGISRRQFHIDQASVTSSNSATATATANNNFNEYTILQNSYPSKRRRLGDEIEEERKSTLHPIVSTTSELNSVVVVKLAGVTLDCEKLATLQERLTLKYLTVAELETQILELLRRKAPQSIVAGAVSVFHSDARIVDELLPVIFPVCIEDNDVAIVYQLDIFTNDPETGDYLAYLNPVN